MEEKGFKWQIFVGAALLALLIAALFLPVVKISGERYIDMAVDVNQYALDHEKDAAKKGGAQDVVDKYEKENGTERKKKVKEFDKKIDENDKDAMSALMFGKWALTAESEDLEIEGVTFQENSEKEKGTGQSDKKDTDGQKKSEKKEKSKKDSDKESEEDSDEEDPYAETIEDSGILAVFKMMGLMLYFPAACAAILLVVMLAAQKTFAPFLIGVGGVAGICDILWFLALPGMLWSKAEDCVDSFTMVDAALLENSKVGGYCITSMIHSFTSWGIWVHAAVAIVLMVSGILFLTACKPQQVSDEEEWDFNMEYGNAFASNIQPVNMVQNSMGGPQGVGFQPNAVFQSYTAFGQEPGFQQGGNVQQESGSQQEFNVQQESGSQREFNFQPDIHSGQDTAKGKITGLCGQYAGQTIEFDTGEEIVLGRDPKFCTLVFDYPKISRKHCGVRFDSQSGMYQVIDYSSNGTRFSNGGMAVAGSYTSVEPGTVIMLANEREEVKLG